MDISVFRGMKICISTPLYRREACLAYHNSRWLLQRYLIGANIQADEHQMGDTYLDRARNLLAAHFLSTDATHQLWFDADMGFDPDDVMRMLYHAAVDEKIWILGAPYPYKEIDWVRVKEAVSTNPDITPAQLECCAAKNWTYRGLPPGTYHFNEPVQLTGDKEHVGTGVMLVSRKAYEALTPNCESYFDQRAGMRVTRFFRCEVKDDEFQGEDVWFCREAISKANVKLWLAAWVKTEHWGLHCYKGDMIAALEAGMEP